MQPLKCATRQNLSEFFYTCIYLSMTTEQAHEVAVDELIYKAQLLALTLWPPSLTETGLVGLSEPESWELSGAEMLLRTGFFQAYLRSLSPHDFHDLSAIGINSFLKSAELETDKEKRRLRNHTAKKFTFWQDIYRQTESFCRQEMPMIIGTIDAQCVRAYRRALLNRS